MTVDLASGELVGWLLWGLQWGAVVLVVLLVAGYAYPATRPLTVHLVRKGWALVGGVLLAGFVAFLGRRFARGQLAAGGDLPEPASPHPHGESDLDQRNAEARADAAEREIEIRDAEDDDDLDRLYELGT